jgi:hypothetical protein
MNARGLTYGTSLALKPTEEEGGVLVTFVVNAATQDCDINYGDGQTGVLAGGHGSHLYTQGGVFDVRVTCQGQVRTATVTVLNSAPIAYPGVTSPGTCGWMERQVVDLRLRYHGCKKSDGSPVSVSGADPVDGDELEYQLTVTGPDGHGNTIEYTVFNLDREKVNGEWTKGGMLVVFVGWDKPYPPYPFFVNPQYVEPKCVVTPTPDPSPTQTLGTVTFTYTVRDKWGETSQTSWTEEISSSSCTSS